MTDEQMKQRIDELEQICGEAYQVVGIVADKAGVFDHPGIVKMMDNLSEARMVHEDILPFQL